MFDMDLTALPEGLTEVACLDADGYVDELPPAPPEPGNYRVRITGMEVQRNAQGDAILDDKKWAIIKINSFEIVEPLREGASPRQCYSYQKFKTRPFAAPRNHESPVTDLIRGLDATATWTDNTDAVRVLQQLIADGKTLTAFVDWNAQDGAWLQEQMSANGGNLNGLPKEEKTQIFNAWKCDTMKKFPTDDRGRAIPIWEGPSGTKFQARPALRKVYKSNKVVKLLTLL